MSKIPTIEDIKNCNRVDVYVKNSLDKPVVIQGNFIQVSDDFEQLTIQTENQYAIFKSAEVVSAHFYKFSLGGI